ncbi:MAG: hypothetical protein ACRDQ2_02590 [Gaiellales bacterium]
MSSNRLTPVGSKADTPHWGMRKRIAVILSTVGAVIAASAVGIAVAGDPPALAWVGFGVAAFVVLALGALAPIAFERTRVSALPPARATDGEQRLLVVADSHCSETEVCNAVVAHLRGAAAVHLVVPVRVSHLHFLTNDEDDEQREAEEVMRITVGLLKQHGVSATGSVGDDKPLESMSDVLASFAATRVLLITPPEEESYWLEHDLLAKARELTDVPVAQVVVPTATTGSNANGRGGAVV